MGETFLRNLVYEARNGIESLVINPKCLEEKDLDRTRQIQRAKCQTLFQSVNKELRFAG